MNKYKVAVEWMMCAFIEVDAASMEQAIEIVEGEESALPDGSYLDDSFVVNLEITRQYNQKLFS